jgi:propanol-preferring alcohol dehydrogenase
MVMHDWGERFRLEERPLPHPGPGEALMRVRAAGVGLTLINMRNGRLGGTVPRVWAMSSAATSSKSARR